MTEKIKKLFFPIWLIVSFLALFLAHETRADLDDVQVQKTSPETVGSSIDTAFSKLGIDQDELKYTIQTMNVSRRKKQQPQVEVSFNPGNPVSGQKVTAVATPTYFLNTAENLYFTWYLKPEDCPDERNTSPSQTIADKCDFDGNGDIDINDYKVKAARIIAGNGFEWNNANYGSGSGGKEYNAIWGGDDQEGKNNHCFVHNVESGDEYEISCNKHLFAETSGVGSDIGDGSFGLEEEKFWHTDPNDPDTADSGNGDEANLAGLGMNSFSWNYKEGDQIGVVIEGISVEPTQEKDSSYKVMWALMNNKCDLGNINIEEYPDTSTSRSISTGSNLCPDGVSTTTIQTKTVSERVILSRVANIAIIRTSTYKTDTEDSNCNGEYEEAAGAAYDQTTTCPNGPDYQGLYNGTTCTGSDETVNLDEEGVSLSEIKKASDINSCLYNNFADPAEGGGIKEKMDITLSYSPEFPMNDPNNADGDELTVLSSIINSQSGSYLKYEWEFFESNEPNPDSWDQITKSRLPKNLQTTGLGLDSIKLKLNIPDLKKYLRVKLTLSEGISGSSVLRKGSTDIVIPISNVTQRIKAYDTTVSNSLSLSPKSSEICLTKGTPDAICMVAKNEIVALSINGTGFSDFLWSVNGKSLTSINSQEVGKTAYLPILENNGYRYNIEVSATNEAGEKINLSKAFEVADPEIGIISTDESACKANLLGYYVDLDGKKWPDYSKTNFSALTGSETKLQAKFYGISPSLSQYYWYVDGNKITSSNASGYGYSIDTNGILTLPEKALGESYNVAVSIIYTQDNNTKKALSEYWGVSFDEFYEKKISTGINIAFVGSISDTQGATNDNLPKKILASVYDAAPAYVIFLIKITLTTFAMIIFSKIILSFFPNLKENGY